MAGMALVLVLAVTQDDRGWTASDRAGQRASGQDTIGQRADVTASSNQSQAGPTFRGGQDWAEFQDALSRPIDRSAPSSDGYGGLRRAQGIDSPPQPPTFGPSAERGRVPQWPAEGRPQPETNRPHPEAMRTPFSVPQIDPRQHAGQNPRAGQLPPDDGLIEVPELAPTDGNDRDVLYEQRLADNRDDGRYLVPPTREYDDGRSRVKPVPFTNREEANYEGTTRDLPPVDLPLSSPGNFDQQEANVQESRSPSEQLESQTQPTGPPQTEDDVDDSGETRQPERSSWPMIWAMVGLFGSVGFNVYLGWIAWDIHGRYQDVVDEVRELENQLDQRQGRTESSDSHRIRA